MESSISSTNTRTLISQYVQEARSQIKLFRQSSQSFEMVLLPTLWPTLSEQ
jgi:hypothetical protein